jgi:hypothetical protein
MSRFIVAAMLLAASPGALRYAAASPQLPTELPSTKFNSGQDIQPYFEGWIRNKDGTFDLLFGYFNRNWQEELAIPVGADNTIEPGGPDRGQPTYFLPRRQAWVYRMRVPTDFGKGVVTWTIKANGKTQKAYGELLPGGGDHRAHRHDPRQPQSRRRRSEQAADDCDRSCQRRGHRYARGARRLGH